MSANRNGVSRAETIAAAQKLLREAAWRRYLIWITAGAFALLAVVVCNDYALLVLNFTNLFGSLPGEPSNALEISMMSLAGLVGVTGFGFYAAQNEGSAVVRAVNHAAGWSILAFIVGMILLTGQYIVNGAADAGALTALPSQLIDGLQANSSPLLQRLLNSIAPWTALCIALVVLIQFYVAETVARIVIANLREIERLRQLDADVRRYLSDLETCPRRRDELCARREALEWQLTPAGRLAFAATCARVIQEALARIAKWMACQEIRIRSASKPLAVDLDAIKRKLAPLLALGPQDLMAMFHTNTGE